MSWTTYIAELRNDLSDGSTDKLRWRKRLFGQIDGVNLVFKTFEFRRITDFSTATAPEGVYVNGSPVTSASDFPEVGEVTLSAAPADGDIVEATYYSQWFKDSELSIFVVNAVKWLGLGTDPNSVAEGLKPAALKYAAAEAYQKLAIRWAEKLSEMFRLEDAPDPERFKSVDTYRNIANDYYKTATTLRDHYYTRQGQSLSPLFANNAGAVRDPQPRR